jgi:hypothetical protein
MKPRFVLLVVLGAALLLGLTAAGYAAITGYSLPWWTVDGGGGLSSGPGYQLHGSTGQADAGPELSGAGYRLAGGYWASAAPAAPEMEVYLPLVVRKY